MNVTRLARVCRFAPLLLATAACADGVTAADLAPRPSPLMELLNGRVAEVGVRGPAAESGARIRICNFVKMVPEHPPLYVVNGRKLSHNDIHAMDINPSQIVNIEIIKGAAATERYGIEAVNGVVLMTLRP